MVHGGGGGVVVEKESGEVFGVVGTVSGGAVSGEGERQVATF